MDRLGLGHTELLADDPRLIYMSMSGMGRTGPQHTLMAYGSLLQGYCGWLTETQEIDGLSFPMGLRPIWTDHVAGAFGATTILAALMHRERTGEGSRIDLSMLEALLAMQASPLSGLHASEPLEYFPHDVYLSRDPDEWVALAVYSEDQWRSLVGAVDTLGWAAELPWSAAGAERHKIDDSLSDWMSRQSVDHAVRVLSDAGVPVARCHSVASLLDDPHLAARRFFVDTPTGPVMALPWIDSLLGRGLVRPSPVLGQDTEAVLAEILGLTPAAIAALAAADALT